MAGKDAGAEAPPPPLGFFQGLLDSLPAALMLLDTAGTIRFAVGQIDRLGDRGSAQLVGSNLGDLAATAEGRALVAELVTAAAARRHGEMVGPVRMPYLDPVGTAHITDMWVVNQSSALGVGGLVVMLVPESAYGYFDEVLVSIVQNASLEETFAALARALRQPPVEGECYFLRPATDDRGVKRFPDLGNAPGPPLPGPWDDIWAGALSAEHENLTRLSSVLREQAGALGYGSLACFAVHPGLEGRADACLVAWARAEGPLAPFARLAIERAVIIASLAMSHRSAEDNLADASLRDPLTGLGNRRGFVEALEALVRAGEQPAILYIDLDGFKEVNENFGQLAGDAVLRVAARRLSSVMRPTDELARLGGDEFAVLCNGAPTGDQMVMIAERVVEQLSRPLSVGDGQTVDVGATVGIALSLPVGTPVDVLLATADHALLEAKSKGPGQWALASAPG
jgi:diguanylate cyclase (GGDEF)-like protein